ncbi:hypothetical protein [Rugamonas apoptosis]|uniref:Uncharacterized protein n=1 Tax=Rugamonas apoptosis TaxID=2758570 RepID=A0A7W2IIQ1_9BURK|nr:hypothetical protein [Rugamonas apoptosis]MBA5685920.1 hypothetical protein [Rugamonas apoptosis]
MTKTVSIAQNIGNVYIGDSPEYKVNSAINELLNALASTPFQFGSSPRKAPSATIAKIEHNHIQSRRHIIRQYLEQSAAIEAAYRGIDSVIPFGKQTVLLNLRNLYFAALDNIGVDYLGGEIELEKLRENAVLVLDFIILKLKNLAIESKNQNCVKEQIEQGINVVVAHAFIECIIFENPENDT